MRLPCMLMSVPVPCDPYRVLIVEDETRLASFIEKGLRKHGLTTAIAEDGQQAIQMALDEAFDLMLLDLGLPILDGFTVLKTLRDQHQVQFPIIVVSAVDDSRKLAAVLDAGANDYMTKPFRFNDLLAKVQSQLNL
jgi:two-component system, OmpR family, copper resistance phosphate regulon response regulator CusR